MRVPRVRFTIRRMMLVVAAVALILAGIITPARLRGLRSHYRAKAADNASPAQLYRLDSEVRGREIKWLPMEAQMLEAPVGVNRYYTPEQTARRVARLLASEGRLRAEAAQYAARAAYHASLKVKYNRAAARPWEWIGPDPQAPPTPPDPELPKLPPGFGIDATR
jgi:hypothetical protein